MMTEKFILPFCNGQCSARYFIRHVYSYLRLRPHLLEQEDYRRLYEECQEYRVYDTYGEMKDDEKYEEKLKKMDFLMDLTQRDETFIHFSDEIVQGFLEARKKVWLAEDVN